MYLLLRCRVPLPPGLTVARLDGVHTLRLCVLSHRQHARHVDELLRVIRDAARAEWAS
jgi:hypothetical protein